MDGHSIGRTAIRKEIDARPPGGARMPESETGRCRAGPITTWGRPDKADVEGGRETAREG